MLHSLDSIPVEYTNAIRFQLIFQISILNRSNILYDFRLFRMPYKFYCLYQLRFIYIFRNHFSHFRLLYGSYHYVFLQFYLQKRPTVATSFPLDFPSHLSNYPRYGFYPFLKDFHVDRCLRSHFRCFIHFLCNYPRNRLVFTFTTRSPGS